FFSSGRRHTRFSRDWSSDVCSSDLMDSTPDKGVTIALLQDKQMVELNKEKAGNNFAVGDIYLGRIKKIMPGLNAAFVDVGYDKDAFLHYLDLGPQVRSLLKLTRIVKNG